MAEQTLMKDGLGAEAIDRMVRGLSQVMPGFSEKTFRKQALAGIDALELKQRVDHVIAMLAKHLPADFPKAAKILRRIKPHWDAGDPDDPLRGFAAWPLTDYVAVYGLAHPDAALQTLEALTPLFTAEFAIRPFLIQHQPLTFEYLQCWQTDRDAHVRRLVSEGTRPRLPWGQRLPQFIKDPKPVLSLLEELKDDPSEMVRRSVANNLNDISKDHPDTVVRVCKRWLKGASDERRWVVRHATRTLVKAGHPQVFGLLGYTASPKMVLRALTLDKKRVRLGQSVAVRAKLQSQAKRRQRLVIDYAMDFVKANGKTNAKVFKWTTLDLAPGEVVELEKKHPLKKITTRQYYAGTHTVRLMINGVSHGAARFHLSVG